MTMDADPPPYLLEDNFGISPLTIMVMNYPVMAEYLLNKHNRTMFSRVEKFDFKPFISSAENVPSLTLLESCAFNRSILIENPVVLKFTDAVWESFGKGRFSRDAMLLFLQLTLSSIGVAIFPPASNQFLPSLIVVAILICAWLGEIFFTVGTQKAQVNRWKNFLGNYKVTLQSDAKLTNTFNQLKEVHETANATFEHLSKNTKSSIPRESVLHMVLGTFVILSQAGALVMRMGFAIADTITLLFALSTAIKIISLFRLLPAAGIACEKLMDGLGGLIGPIFAIGGVLLTLWGSSLSVIESTSSEIGNTTSLVNLTKMSSIAVAPYSLGLALLICLLSIFNTPSNYKELCFENRLRRAKFCAQYLFNSTARRKIDEKIAEPLTTVNDGRFELIFEELKDKALLKAAMDFVESEEIFD